MIVQAATYHSEAEIIAAHRARQARFAAAAKTIKQDQPIAKVIAYRPYMAKKIPLWQLEDIHFDAHTTAFSLWRAEVLAVNGSPMKAYIRRRCMEMNVEFDHVMAKTRKRHVAAIRQLLMWEIKTLIKPEASLPEIGRLFGGKDHTTVLHAIRAVEARKARGE